jgi:transcriptional regulator with XRE-family HTH domain
MKQPELGQKIQDLRKQKGLTQEELVEKCNINVRTIQRIEAGEVTPRPYTIKTILAALDYEFNKIQTTEKDLYFPDNNKSYALRTLLLACIFGGIYFLLGFFEFFADTDRLTYNTISIPTSVYIFLKVAILLSFVFFMKGFWVLGSVLNDTLLKFSSIVLIVISAVVYLHDIVSLFYEIFPMLYFLGMISFCFGAVGIFFGVAIIRLQKHLGTLAVLTGVFEIGVSFLFLTVFLGWLGYILLTPLILLEIFVLYRFLEKFKNEPA